MITFTHTQSDPATSWSITHGLGQKVASDVIIEVSGVRSQVQPLKIVQLNNNQLRVDFTTARIGTVRIATSGAYVLPSWTWVPDDISVPLEYPPLTLLTENNTPLQVDPGGQYLEVDV